MASRQPRGLSAGTICVSVFPRTQNSSPHTESPPRLRSVAVFDRYHLHYIDFLFHPSTFAYVVPSHCAVDLRANVIDLPEAAAPSWTGLSSSLCRSPTPLLTLSRSGADTNFPSATINSTVAYPQLGSVLNVQGLQVVKPYDIKRPTSSNGKVHGCRDRTLINICTGLYTRHTPKIQKNQSDEGRESGNVKV